MTLQTPIPVLSCPFTPEHHGLFNLPPPPAEAPQTTLSIAALAFHGDKAETVRALSELLAIDADHAAMLIDKAPVRVRRGVGPADIDRLIAGLRALRADFAIRDEQTGVATTYAGAPVEESAPPLPVETVAAVHESAPPPAPVAIDVEIADEPSLLEVHGIVPFAEFTAPVLSKPPPALTKCGACARFHEKGAKCRHCGWSDADKKRYCDKCGKGVALASGLPRAGLVTLIALGVAAGIALAGRFGTSIGLGAAAVAVAAAVLFDAAKLRYACAACKRDAATRWLLPLEKVQLAQVRTRWMRASAGGFPLALVIGLVGSGSHGGGGMVIDSFGLSFHTTLPRSAVAPPLEGFEFESEFGASRMFSRVVTSAKSTVHTRALSEIVIARELSPVIDEAALDRLMELQIQKIVPGAKVSASVVIPMKETDSPSHEVRFEGKVGNLPAYGKARAYLFEVNEVVVVLYASSAATGMSDPDGTAYLDSFVVDRAKGD